MESLDAVRDGAGELRLYRLDGCRGALGAIQVNPIRFEDEFPEASSVLMKLSAQPNRKIIQWHFDQLGNIWEKILGSWIRTRWAL